MKHEHFTITKEREVPFYKGERVPVVTQKKRAVRKLSSIEKELIVLGLVDRKGGE